MALGGVGGLGCGSWGGNTGVAEGQTMGQEGRGGSGGGGGGEEK